MKITIELEVDQEAYDRKYGPGTEWWTKYSYDQVLDAESNQYVGVPKPASVYLFAPDKAKDMWNEMLRDILSEGLYDWTQLHDDAVKIDIKFP